jgi:hypothetical protein
MRILSRNPSVVSDPSAVNTASSEAATTAGQTDDSSSPTNNSNSNNQSNGIKPVRSRSSPRNVLHFLPNNGSNKTNSKDNNSSSSSSKTTSNNSIPPDLPTSSSPVLLTTVTVVDQTTPSKPDNSSNSGGWISEEIPKGIVSKQSKELRRQLFDAQDQDDDEDDHNHNHNVDKDTTPLLSTTSSTTTKTTTPGVSTVSRSHQISTTTKVPLTGANENKNRKDDANNTSSLKKDAPKKGHTKKLIERLGRSGKSKRAAAAVLAVPATITATKAATSSPAGEKAVNQSQDETEEAVLKLEDAPIESTTDNAKTSNTPDSSSASSSVNHEKNSKMAGTMSNQKSIEIKPSKWSTSNSNFDDPPVDVISLASSQSCVDSKSREGSKQKREDAAYTSIVDMLAKPKSNRDHRAGGREQEEKKEDYGDGSNHTCHASESFPFLPTSSSSAASPMAQLGDHSKRLLFQYVHPNTARKVLEILQCGTDVTTTMSSFAKDPFHSRAEQQQMLFDSAFTTRFLRDIKTTGVTVLHLQPPESSYNTSPNWSGRAVSMMIEPGTASSSPSSGEYGETMEPKLEWTILPGGGRFDVYTTSVSLLSIQSIAACVDPDATDGDYLDQVYFTIMTHQGDVHIFEANSYDDRERIVNGLRNVIARLAFSLVAGDVHQTHGLYNVGKQSSSTAVVLSPDHAMNQIAHSLLE